MSEARTRRKGWNFQEPRSPYAAMGSPGQCLESHPDLANPVLRAASARGARLPGAPGPGLSAQRNRLNQSRCGCSIPLGLLHVSPAGHSHRGALRGSRGSSGPGAGGRRKNHSLLPSCSKPGEPSLSTPPPDRTCAPASGRGPPGFPRSQKPL